MGFHSLTILGRILIISPYLITTRFQPGYPDFSLLQLRGPIVAEKTEGPSTSLEFLRITLDTNKF